MRRSSSTTTTTSVNPLSISICRRVGRRAILLLLRRLLRLRLLLLCHLHLSLIRQQALGRPKLYQRHHRLHLLLCQQAKQLPHAHKVNETRVQLLVCIQMPEGVQPMPVVQVCVAAHHLSIDTANVRFKVFGKARCFAEPVTA